MDEIGIESVEYVSSLLAETLFLFDEIKRDRYVLLLDVGYITSSIRAGPAATASCSSAPFRWAAGILPEILPPRWKFPLPRRRA